MPPPSPPRREDIASFALSHVAEHPGDLSRVIADRFGISRQAAHRHLAALVEQGTLQVSGRTRGRRYTRGLQADWTHTYVLGPAFQEDVVWRADLAPLLAPLPDSVRAIWAHGFAQVLDNAAAHSGGRRVTISVTTTGRHTRALVKDDGVGVFRKLRRAFGLLDEPHARLELAKGDLTTDPAGHTGRGLAQLARLFDSVQIVSGGLYLSNSPTADVEWLTEFDDFDAGTAIVLVLANDSRRNIADAESPAAVVVPVRLARYGDDPLVSRSQARRLMARLEHRSEVVLDFTGIPSISAAFADEVFRVFVNAHPGVVIRPMGMTEAVSQTAGRAVEDQRPDSETPSVPPTPDPE